MDKPIKFERPNIFDHPFPEPGEPDVYVLMANGLMRYRTMTLAQARAEYPEIAVDRPEPPPPTEWYRGRKRP